MQSSDVQKCPLCGVEAKLTKHHLCPQVKCKGKHKAIKEDESNIAWICEACHRTLHAYYTENELRDRLSTLESLKADDKISAFVKWRAKHPDAEVSPAKMSNARRRRR